LAQPVGGAAQGWRRDVGDERVARRATNSFADAIDEPADEDPGD
jgi:hypothetical protein